MKAAPKTDWVDVRRCSGGFASHLTPDMIGLIGATGGAYQDCRSRYSCFLSALMEKLRAGACRALSSCEVRAYQHFAFYNVAFGTFSS